MRERFSQNRMRIVAVLIIVYVVMCRMNHVVSDYSKTLKHISANSQIPMSQLWALFPRKYIVMQRLMQFRWLILSALIYLSWLSALICFSLFDVWDYFSPKHDDYRNAKKAYEELQRNRNAVSEEYYARLNNVLAHIISDFEQ